MTELDGLGLLLKQYEVYLDGTFRQSVEIERLDQRKANLGISNRSNIMNMRMTDQ
jgi:hypothetical protein